MDVVLVACFLFSLIYMSIEGSNRHAKRSKPALVNMPQSSMLWTLRTTESIYTIPAKSQR